MSTLLYVDSSKPYAFGKLKYQYQTMTNVNLKCLNLLVSPITG